jgi:hypothetical protein
MRPVLPITVLLCLFAIGRLYCQPSHIDGPIFYSAEQSPQFNGSLQDYFTDQWREKLSGIKGIAIIELLVGTNGKACYSLVSAGLIGVTADEMRNSINSMPPWSPARQNGHLVNFKVRLTLTAKDDSLQVAYINEKAPIPQPVLNNKTENHPAVFQDKHHATWKRWDFKNSMVPADLSRNIAMDHNGIIWYCTDHGLVRIEGDDWKVFTGTNVPALAGRNKYTWTTGLTIDMTGNVWVLSANHVVCYDGREWTTYDTSNSPLKFVSRIDVDRTRTLWFSSFDGLVRKDASGWTKFTTTNSGLSSNSVNQSYLDIYGTLWVATDQGISKLTNGKWESLNSSNTALKNDHVTCVKGDSQGNIWAGLGFKNGETFLAKIDPNARISCYSTSAIWNIIPDTSTGEIWLATNGSGLVFTDTK